MRQSEFHDLCGSTQIAVSWAVFAVFTNWDLYCDSLVSKPRWQQQERRHALPRKTIRRSLTHPSNNPPWIQYDKQDVAMLNDYTVYCTHSTATTMMKAEDRSRKNTSIIRPRPYSYICRKINWNLPQPQPVFLQLRRFASVHQPVAGTSSPFLVSGYHNLLLRAWPQQWNYRVSS
jgi:hypothetical protein